MFKNIGKKLKVLAHVLFWVELIGAAVGGLVMIEDLVALPVIAGGILVAWVSSMFIYGFGELIDKTCEIAANTGSGKAKPETKEEDEDEEEADTGVESTHYSNK